MFVYVASKHLECSKSDPSRRDRVPNTRFWMSLSTSQTQVRHKLLLVSDLYVAFLSLTIPSVSCSLRCMLTATSR